LGRYEDSGPLAEVFREFKKRYGSEFNSLEELEQALKEFMEWWNRHRARR
jgi:hypothetical protein